MKKSDLLPLIGNDINNLDDEVLFKHNDTTVWLHFDKMLPYEKRGENETLFGMTKVLFQTGIKKNEVYIGNFTGNLSKEEKVKYGPWTIEDEAGCYVAAHMDAIDFSKIPDSELTIGFEANGLLKVYKMNGQDDEYTIILNPENPFGLSVSVSSFTEVSGSTEELQTVEKKDAYPLCAYWYKRANGVSIVYARPNRFDVSGYEVYYSDKNNRLEAELIYSGNDTAFLYSPESPETAWDGYYWISTVFNDDSESDFIQINRLESAEGLFK